MRVIYTAGCWDLLHRGHLNLLHASRAMGDVLVVGVVSDWGAKAYKGRLPVENLGVRMENVRGLGFVDLVVQQETTDPTPVLERIRPDAMTHGDDWPRLREGHDSLERLGVEWVLVPYTPDISTTLLRRKGVDPAPDGAVWACRTGLGFADESGRCDFHASAACLQLIHVFPAAR